MILNYAKQWTALLIAGSYTNSAENIPNYLMLGSGSGVTVNTATTLISPTDRQAVTSTNSTVAYKIKYSGYWSNGEISGLTLKEWGLAGSATGTTGSMWTRNSLQPLQFDGTQELTIEETIVVY